MGNKGKPDHSAMEPEHGAAEHAATRRKILKGLAGAPVFLTFSQRVGAVESFARCIENAIPSSHGDLTGYYIDGNDVIYYPDDKFCESAPAFASLSEIPECYLSFSVGAATDENYGTPQPCKERKK